MKTKIVFILAAAFCLMLGTAIIGSAQKPDKAKTIDLKSTRGENTRGKDKNIKQGEKANSPNAKVDPPAAKGGTSRGKGDGCRVEFDNSTSWFIKVYVDGAYRGTMAPWDDSYVYVYPGDTRVYARADFTDGSYRYWGPREYDCRDGQYINFRMLP